ncbi:hypothetical protein G7Y79_00039g076050 [Physcia stellaris]|nr:hypothetical protein G7Y79_00039g076050 [Physcia stellaris]
MTKRLWQCLQTEDERENVEKEMRIEEEEYREIRENDMRIDCLIGACIAENASNLTDLKADKIIALKYDVMRLCMEPDLQLLLPVTFGEEERIWCRCRPNGLGFPANMRNRSSTSLHIDLDVAIGRREGFGATTGRETISAQDIGFLGVATDEVDDTLSERSRTISGVEIARDKSFDDAGDEKMID